VASVTDLVLLPTVFPLKGGDLPRGSLPVGQGFRHCDASGVHGGVDWVGRAVGVL